MCSYLKTDIQKVDKNQEKPNYISSKLDMQCTNYLTLLCKTPTVFCKESSYWFYFYIRELSSYHHISKKIVWKYYTPPFQFDHLPTQVSKSPYRLKVSESAIVFAHLFRGLAPTDLFVSKKPKIWKFSIWVSFETWTLKGQKSISFETFGLFGTCYEKMCPSFLWKTSS